MARWAIFRKSSWEARGWPSCIIEWCWDGWFGFGFHVDTKRRKTFGPYVALHFLWFVLSIGRNPRASMIAEWIDVEKFGRDEAERRKRERYKRQFAIKRGVR